MSSEQKKVLRNHFRSLRQQLSLEAQADSAKQASHHFIKQECFKKSMNIACYLSVKSEIDVMPLMEMIWTHGKRCYLPILTDQNDLAFVYFEQHDELVPNRFGILEPKPDKHHIELMQLDLVIMPLIAYDRYGHRLGAGGGYYDRTFAKIEKNPYQPFRVGWAYAFQQSDQLPHDNWDIDLHAVQTEAGFTKF